SGEADGFSRVIWTTDPCTSLKILLIETKLEFFSFSVWAKISNFSTWKNIPENRKLNANMSINTGFFI
ncbi:MAG: hypothetical protein QOK84_05235, partial [Nitrososphaeraceae archaeon]|nr:hypothetical protein [Nitrososphaeraceae archaeon]